MIRRDPMDAVRALTIWAESGGLATVERLSGGQQNTNYKVVTTSGAAFVCRVPGVDAGEHGQSHRTVYGNSCAAHAILGVAKDTIEY